MNKKLLIASLFATLMLLVPMTSVVGVSDVEEDCGCQVISSHNLVRAERLLARLEVYINIILLRFGYIPEVAEKSEEILDIINSDGIGEVFCNTFWIVIVYIGELSNQFPPSSLIRLMIILATNSLWRIYFLICL